MTAGLAAAVLADRHRRFALFAAAIAGQPVRILAYEGLPSLARAHLGQAAWLPGGLTGLADVATPDVACVALPASTCLFASADDNLAALRVEVLRQVGVASPAVGAALHTRLALSARPVLLRRLFRMAERVRADAALPMLYPGAAQALVLARCEELARRSPVQPGRRLAALVDALHRFALGAPRDALLAQDASGQLAPLLDAMASLQDGHATGLDSLGVAQWLLHALASAGRWLSGRGMTDATMALASSAGVPVPTGRRTASQRDRSAGNTASDVANSLENAEPDEAARAVDSRGHPKRPASAISFHDEWDHAAQRYLRGWVQVHEHALAGQDSQFLQQVRQRHGATAQQVRRRFAAIRPELRQRQRRQLDGDDIDLESAVQHRVERRLGRTGDGRVFTAHHDVRRDVAAAFLMDMSGSTSYRVPDPADAELLDETSDDSPLYAPSQAVAWLQQRPPARRVIDVAKEALCLMCEALHGLGDRHAVYGFSGQGRHEVEFHIAKEFHEPWSDRSARAIAAMQPRRYTRTGAALRHATRRLAREAARTRVLIVITDGYPQDVDYGPEPTRHDYGVHDTAQALREARRAGISTFCISINHADHDYLRQMCAPDRYLVLEDIGELPAQLGKVYRSLTAGL